MAPKAPSQNSNIQVRCLSRLKISVYQNIFLTSTKTFWALAYFQFVAQIHTLPYNLISFLCGKRPLFFWPCPILPIPLKNKNILPSNLTPKIRFASNFTSKSDSHQTLLRPAVARSNILINADVLTSQNDPPLCPHFGV